MKRAIFLDRDGVLNRNVLNPATGKYESPLTAKQFEILPGVIPALQLVSEAGYLLFLVSNQPNYVNGKADRKELDAIHQKLEDQLRGNGIFFAAFYYCRHHPAFDGPCACRKPSPWFLLQACERFAINLGSSWMIGDRESDIECGRNAGVKTIRIVNGNREHTAADHVAPDLWSAVQMVLPSYSVPCESMLRVSI